jgi:hypothetical protein
LGLVKYYRKLRISSDTYIQDEQIQWQIDQLNVVFEPAGFHFELQDISHWAYAHGSTTHPGENPTFELGKHLRQGDFAALNIYVIQSFDTPGTAGVSGFPLPPDSVRANSWRIDLCHG